jgi:hypothetical protein
MKSNFPHRLNRNGHYDSMCSVCLVTVASARNEADLTRYELGHACNPIRLSQLSEFESHAHTDPEAA